MSRPSAAELPAAVHAAVLEVAPEKRPELDAGTRLVDDLGFHSLALLELAYLLEDEFELPPLDVETAQRIVTVGDVVEHVREELARQAG
jgi:acyl carrier protein